MKIWKIYERNIDAYRANIGHTMKPNHTWSAKEESCLYTSAFDLASELRKNKTKITINSPVIASLKKLFEQKKESLGISGDSVQRDEMSIIERLTNFKIFNRTRPTIGGKKVFVYKYNSNCRIVEFAPRTLKYSKFFAYLQSQEQLMNQIDFIFQQHLNNNKCVKEACKLIDSDLEKLTIDVEKYADVLHDRLSRYFLKIDLGYIKDPKGKRTSPESAQAKTSAPRLFKESVFDRKVDTNTLNEKREEIAKFYESGKDLEQASFISCSVGTGIGKSYGALQSYVNIVNEQFELAVKQEPTTSENIESVYLELGKKGFTNFVFMTPQKAQIDLDATNLTKLVDRGVHLISILSRADFTSPSYVDWLTGQNNFQFYEQIFQKHKKSHPHCLSLLKSIKHDEDTLAAYKADKSNPEAVQIIEKKLVASRVQLFNSIKELTVELINQTKLSFEDIVLRGAKAERIYAEKLKDKSRTTKPSFSRELALFALVKRVLPYDVCEVVPCVLAMTSQKSLAPQNKLKGSLGKKGYNIKADVSFDSIVGSKDKNKDVLVSSALYLPEKEQMEFIKNTFLAIDENCRYKSKNINFFIVIDELHKSYEDHFKSTFTNLINEETHLCHVLSSAATLVKHANNLINSGWNLDTVTDDTEDGELMQHILQFRNRLNTYFNDRSHFSEGINGLDLLASFENSGGTFEVSGTDATEITKITKNVFAFNSKLFTNLDELKSIRVYHKLGIGSRTLYFDKKDSTDKNPTLYDVYQLVLALVATGSGVKNKEFARWIKEGGYNRDGNHHVLYDFITQVRKVSKEVSSLLDQPELQDETIEVNTLYAYFQPKVTFSFAPLLKYEGTDFKGSEKKIRLTFELNLINASPEVSYLRMLKGTKNTLLPLSATCGYHKIYDGNYSTMFMKKMCANLGINYQERDKNNLQQVEKLVEDRAIHRNVNFNVIDEKALTFNSEPLPIELKMAHAQFEKRLVNFESDGKLLPIHALRSPFKKIEIMRQFNNMFYCLHHKQNAISLSISHEFQNMLSAFVMHNFEFLKTNYNLDVLYPHPSKLTDNDHVKAFEFEPVRGEGKLRVVLYDTSLTRGIEACELSEMKELVTIKDDKTNIILMGSFGSAGTGLNNVISYQFDNEVFQEDYQNLFICGSPYYSSVKGKEPTLDSLNNFALMIKHWGDQPKLRMKLGDMPLTLNNGDSKEVLMNEHNLSIQKLILQCIGRIERRDTKLTSYVHVPEDVLSSSAFVFKGLSKNSRSNQNYRLFQGLSLLGKSYANYAISYMSQRSFKSDQERTLFENETGLDGESIDNSHCFELTRVIQNYQKTGDINSLELNEAFRDESCFTNPEKWMKKVKKAAKRANAKNVAASAEKMFINQNRIGNIRLCEKNTGNGFELTDFQNGSKAYTPWDMIFPSYASDVYTEGDEFTKSLFTKINKMKSIAEKSGYIPSKAIIPLLRGNVGEIMVKAVISHLGHTPMSAEEVKNKLGTEVYERFDFFYIVDNRLYCVDAKFWATNRDNPQLTSSVVSAAKERKPKCVLDSIEKQSGGQFEKVVFIYANAFYGDSVFTEKNRELNCDSTVAYTNIFCKTQAYRQELSVTKNKSTGKESKQFVNKAYSNIHISNKFSNLFIA